MNEREDFFWLMGLLEGEGSFMQGPPSDPTRPRISIQMTDEDIIRRVARLFDRKYHKCKNRSPKNWQDSYAVQIRGKRAATLMRKLRPYMSERRRFLICANLR